MCDLEVKVWTPSNPPPPEVLSELDVLGEESGVSQKLKSPITSSSLFLSPRALSESQTLYTLHSPTSLLGYAKTGLKNLYLYDPSSPKSSLKPYPSTLSLLDIYTPHQRLGYGKLLMDAIYSSNPTKRIAYDRPSSMLPGFLSKNYGMENGEKQNNGYMVFRDFFQE
ncbi:hypothetical protein TrVE_jg13701 [Triparma verrucosa]|uniref:N-acetyltransferase domain-containing protein n=1 Tax=Triparma verrucosa TaxID=1606542 RepID=A0A9W7EXH2_9STRA|nr:hypothetical protein TrVE_jg13701 [Triparma verrucosa]